MELITPNAIESVAWEGELEAPPTSYTVGGKPPRATVGRPEVWPAAEVLRSPALQSEALPTWIPPIGNADFWLVRLACTFRPPDAATSISEADQKLILRPRNLDATHGTTYAYSLFPDRIGVEDSVDLCASLSPQLTFGEANVKVGELGAKIRYSSLFPVVQSYGAGSSTPSWTFKAHPTRPIHGDLFVYVVVAAEKTAGGVRGLVSLTATVDGPFGLQRWGSPEPVKNQKSFEIP